MNYSKIAMKHVQQVVLKLGCGFLANPILIRYIHIFGIVITEVIATQCAWNRLGANKKFVSVRIIIGNRNEM